MCAVFVLFCINKTQKGGSATQQNVTLCSHANVDSNSKSPYISAVTLDKSLNFQVPRIL